MLDPQYAEDRLRSTLSFVALDVMRYTVGSIPCLRIHNSLSTFFMVSRLEMPGIIYGRGP